MTTADQAATITTLASFSGANGGYDPGSLITDANGNLFGTTLTEGAGGGLSGTIFELAKTTTGYAGTPTTLANFDGTNASYPASLIADANGDLFGTTAAGGADGRGTVFELAKTATGYAGTPLTLASFNGFDGTDPEGQLIVDANGDLFGTTGDGGASNGGTVFEITKTASGYANIPMTLANLNDSSGTHTDFGLTTDGSGDLFGTTQVGGADNGGTVFEIAKTATGYANAPVTLANFNLTNDARPMSGLIIDAEGDLFGATDSLSENSYATVFEIAKTDSGYASTPTTLASFSPTNGIPTWVGSLIADTNGDLFGVTDRGGASGEGTIFEIAKTPTGYADTPTTLANFDGTNGYHPSSLIAGVNGDLFGTTGAIGANGGGTVFEVATSGFVPPGSATPAPPSWGAFDVRDLTLGIDYSASPLSNAFTSAWLPEDSVVVAALRPDAFLQTGAGSDVLAAQAGGDNVLDDTGGPANFEIGGAGKDAYFFDASHDPVSWNTIVGFHAGDFAAIFGIGSQNLAANAADGLGAPGYTGLTLRTTAQDGGTAFVTLAGYGTASLNNGSLTTAFGTDPANGREYMLIQAT